MLTVKNLDLKKLPVGYKQDLKIGPASVLCCTDGEVKEYAAEITRIDMNHEDSNKSFVIQITDKELWKKQVGSFRECLEVLCSRMENSLVP